MLVVFPSFWTTIFEAFFVFFVSGSGGFSYLLEPLWWAGMIASKENNTFTFNLLHADALIEVALGLKIWNQFCIFIIY